MARLADVLEDQERRTRAEQGIAKDKPLAHWAVRKWTGMTPSNPDYDDCLQEAMIALWRSWMLYDPNVKNPRNPSKSIEPATYAAVAIKNAVKRHVQIRDRYGFKGLGDSRPGIDMKSVSPLRLEFKPLEEDDHIPDLGCSDWLQQFDEGVEVSETRKRVWIAMGRLLEENERMAVIIYARYFRGCTLDEVGQRFDICRERVRQIERAAKDKLRDFLTCE